ncbi:hypothetical protein KJ652_03440 [Patescibacteria group bacterium]|nr:hypothetical protein [Patescibacteria group bacterium]MBU1123619.1 hypothetical protein [Patescibacteria group bacterium]MBU1911343.1 hypothetical protein [Patescibacteria group bacterium]
MAKQKQKQEPEMTMEDLYNFIMEEIEPELTTFNIPTLDELYKDESKKERKKRLERYKAAMEDCMKRMDEAFAAWEDDFNGVYKMAFKNIEQYVQGEESDEMSDIEESISKS